jgi:hypothetical protein
MGMERKDPSRNGCACDQDRDIIKRKDPLCDSYARDRHKMELKRKDRLCDKCFSCDLGILTP